MAGNPFVVGEEEDATSNLPDAETFSNLKDQWTTFLGNPKAQAFLMNAGIALSQPPHFGDTGASVFGRAVGHGAEAVSRQEAMDIRKQEAESKAAAREAAANLAGARAGAVGLQAQIQAERLQQAQEREANRLTLGKLTASNQLRAEHGRVVRAIGASNAKLAGDILNRPGTPGYRPPAPIPSFEEWVASDPAARSIAERAGLPVGAPAQRVLSPDEQEALDWANQNPNDPRAQAIHDKLGR